MPARFEAILPRLKELAYLRSAAAVLDWDQQVFMPPKGAGPRGEVLAYLSVLSHGKATDAEFIAQVQDLYDDPSGLSDREQAAVRELRRDLERAQKLPESFVRELAETASAAFHVWETARPASDFAAFAPHLEKMVALKRQEAEFLGYGASPYDALLDEYEPGLTAAAATEIFTTLRAGLTDILANLRPNSGPSLEGSFSQPDQEAFFATLLEGLGFDMQAGRLDHSAHPFSTTFHPHDQRITTRYDEKDIFGALFGVIHEMGHALYEYGLPEDQFGTPLAEAASYAVHESQSRGWENMVGRSRAFWTFWRPRLAASFPEPFAHVSADDLYRAINTVQSSLIRTESDEVTYNLHIIVRFEVEKALIEGTLAVKDAPAFWDARMKEYLGVDVPDDRRGILQDVHWSGGMIGYFPSYALGNVYAAQLSAAQHRDIPDLDVQIAAGNFAPYREWNRAHIHQYGRQYLPGDLIERATGEKPDPKYLLEYLREKYATVGA